MRRLAVAFPALLFLGYVGGCKKKADEHVDYRPSAAERSSKEFLIPRNLRIEIEKMYLEFLRKENPKLVLSDENLLGHIPREFLDVDVRLRSSAPGVLMDHSKIALPRGGGEVDFKNYVVGSKGSFYLTFHIKRSGEENERAQTPRIFYLSEARKRKIAGESYGAGCKKYMDVTNVMMKSFEDGGFQLNATEQRYLSVVGGIFYFVDFSSEQKIYLAAVRFKDSRYMDLMCEEE